MWQPGLSWDNAKKRAEIIRTVREFFYQREVIEVETPMLSHGTVTDVHLEAFKTSAPSDDQQQVYLQTSPEYAMKRLLASGYQSIYQLSKSFRFEQQGRYHNPEFTMLEWYRLGFDHFSLMDEVEAFLIEVLKVKKAERVSYQEVFQQQLDIDPLTCTLDGLKACLLEQHISGDWIAQEQDKDILLQVLFSECIENKIGQNNPCFVYHYPKSQAALSKLSSDDPRVAARFECYYKGIELANGFYELDDANEQLRRFKQDNLIREQLNRESKPIDFHFINALEHGLPECSGVALGIDRLVMLALKLSDIENAMTFSFKNA